MSGDLRLSPMLKERLSYVYAERCVVEREDRAVALWDDEGMTQVPVASIALLMLGPGTKISHAAVEVLASNGCLIAWVGEHGVRMYAFGTGGTRSASGLILQARCVSDPEARMRIVRKLFAKRFPDALDPTMTIQQIRGKEGMAMRASYRELARRYGVPWEGRNLDAPSWEDNDTLNRALSAANACLYGDVVERVI